jgi:hypothetical protein
MAGYYPTGCDENIQAHSCGQCGVELSRVRGVAFINASYYPTIINDLTDDAAWAAGIASGAIVLYPETQGEFDGGTPNMGQGYGDTEEQLNSYTFNLQFKDPNYKNNRNHFNSIKGSRNFHVVFRSETVWAVSDVPCTIVPKNPIANDLKVERTWDVEVKWTSENFPDETDANLPSLAVCYIP